ncbi:DUF1900-domain-containing protein [Microthyrium microscopicum]|uniref:Coronin n=1 Tax=Microthyrium microscopicum TaxID=703497 RepID=A0A6A6UVV0_9PEZI|nr:DUF1900-domain-containing protein [Microthyrium microscopicum]
MAGRFVRASKYRHVYGQSTKKDQCYDNLRISKNAWDTNIIKANPEFISVNWEASGGGAFAVIPVNQRGKLPDGIPLFRGHTAAVLDTDWNPFDDNLLSSSSDDGKVFLWRVPKDFTLYSDSDEPADISPVAKLTGHARKVGHVLFNPAAQNVLASASGDYSVKLWDIEQGKDRLSLKHGEIVQSLSWSADGAYLVTTCRDKKLRIWDTRQQKPAQEVQGHPGAKNSRAVWLGDRDRIATTGFSRMSDRQLGLWDVKMPKEPVGGDFTILDSISGVCMPFWDDGNRILYLAGKGDGNIRYYELENDKFEYLSEYKSSDPQRGMAFLPKRGVNVHENEVARAFKTVNDSFIEPISFIVPRRAEVFQDDIYPPTIGLKSAVSAAEWFDGKSGVPPLVSLKGRYDGGEANELPASEQPQTKSTPVSSPPPTKTEAPKPKAAEPAPAPKTVAAPPARTKLEDNKQAMSSMADKFADKDEDSSDDASSFEEVAKPIERHVPRDAASAKAAPSLERSSSSTTKLWQPAGSTAAAPASTPALAEKAPEKAPEKPAAKATPTPTPAPAAAPAPEPSSTAKTASGPGEALKTHLSDIKGEIAGLKSQVGELTELVRSLAGRLNEMAGSQNERIRAVELEVEGMRE